MIVGLGGSLFSVPAFAEPANNLEDIQDQRKEIKENLSESDKQITAILIELETLNKEIDQVNQKLIENQALVNETESNIEATLVDISDLEKEMKELEIQIEERYEILKDRIVSTQKTGGAISYLEVIFGAQDFSDFITRVSAVNKIADSDAALIEQQENDIQEVEDKRNKVFDKLNELTAMKTKQEETKAIISQQLEDSDQQKNKLENKQQELVVLADDLKLEDSELASLEQSVKQRLLAESEKAEEKSTNTEKTMVEELEVQIASVKSESTEEVKVDKPKESNPVKPVKKEQPKPKQEVEEEKAAVKEEETPVREEKTPVKEEKEEEKQASKTFTVTSTAYTADCAGCSGYTATGINLKANPDAKVIAVDPSIIPLGSTVFVEGYGYAKAGDTGGAIKGKKIDVFVPTKQEALSWGVRTVKVTIVE